MIVGAGASIPFVPELSSPTITKELKDWNNWKNVMTKIPLDVKVSRRKIKSIVKVILRRVSSETNFEHIIEIIDKVCGYYINDNKSLFNKLVAIIKRSHKFNERCIGRNYNCYVIVPFLAREVIASVILRKLADSADEKLFTKQTEFIKSIEDESDKLSIISLNYDDILHRTLDSVKDADGELFCNGFTDSTSDGEILDFEKLISAPYSIVYPHGSILFNYKSFGRIVFIGTRREAERERWKSLAEEYYPMRASFGRQGINTIDFNTFIVSGQSKESTMVKEPFGKLYQKAVYDIYQSNIVIIIGYSFNDEHINRVLSYYAKAQKEYKILIIDKQDLNNGNCTQISQIVDILSVRSQVDVTFDSKKVIRIPSDVLSNKYGWLANRVYYYSKGYGEFLNEYETVLDLLLAK